MTPRHYLSISLYHPQVLRGGAQVIAYDLFDQAQCDNAWKATFVGAIDAVAFPQYNRVGATLTRFGEAENELLLLTQSFDSFYHLALDERRTQALRAMFLNVQPDVIHFHHSLLIGLETLRIARECCPKATIAYTLHEYLPICRNNGHLIKTMSNLICQTAEPHQCVQCFSDQDIDRYVVRRRLFQTYFRDVDVFIAPTGYLKDRFVQWGLQADRIVVIPNGHRSVGQHDSPQGSSQQVNRFGFFGQYVDAKGIDVLIAAAVRAANQTDDDVIVKIFGGNKQYASPAYVEKIDKLLTDAPKNLLVEEHGSYQREAVFELMNQVDWVVVPPFGPRLSRSWSRKHGKRSAPSSPRTRVDLANASRSSTMASCFSPATRSS
jgi:glycosyltransferase involved in cell wall biosynthesis